MNMEESKRFWQDIEERKSQEDSIIKRIREEAYLFFLEKAIEGARTEEWIGKNMDNFKSYFPGRYNLPILGALLSAKSEEILQRFLSACPSDEEGIHVYCAPSWIAQYCENQKRSGEEGIERIKSVLYFSKIEEYLKNIPRDEIVGRGGKPGKSFLRRYVKDMTGLDISIAYQAQRPMFMSFREGGSEFSFEVSPEIVFMAKALGMESMRSIHAQRYDASCQGVLHAILDARMYLNTERVFL